MNRSIQVEGAFAVIKEDMKRKTGADKK